MDPQLNQLIASIKQRIDFLTTELNPSDYVGGKVSAYTDVLFLIQTLEETQTETENKGQVHP